MKVTAILAIGLFWVVSAVFGQNSHGTGNYPVLSPPKALCEFDRTHAVVMRVKSSAPSLDFSSSLEKPIYFPVGTLVSVSRREQSWSCVTGSIHTPNGHSTRTGWMQSSQLDTVPRSK